MKTAVHENVFFDAGQSAQVFARIDPITAVDPGPGVEHQIRAKAEMNGMNTAGVGLQKSRIFWFRDEWNVEQHVRLFPPR